MSYWLPGAHVYFSIAHRKIAGHSIQMRVAAGSDYGIEQMLRAAEVMAHVHYRFFAGPRIPGRFNRHSRRIRSDRKSSWC